MVHHYNVYIYISKQGWYEGEKVNKTRNKRSIVRSNNSALDRVQVRIVGLPCVVVCAVGNATASVFVAGIGRIAIVEYFRVASVCRCVSSRGRRRRR